MQVQIYIKNMERYNLKEDLLNYKNITLTAPVVLLKKHVQICFFNTKLLTSPKLQTYKECLTSNI